MPAPHHSSALRTLAHSYKPTQLLHLHLPGLTLFTTASAIQERIVQRHFAAKDELRRAQDGSASAPPQTSAPPPLILTFSTPPTYTVGRRYLTTNPLPASQIDFLQGLDASFSTGPLAAFHTSPRGGDLTYHGPGQLTAYAIIDLRTHDLTPRCYVRLLEETVMRTCGRLGVRNTTTTTDPGVWISEREPSVSHSSSTSSNTSPPSSPTATDRKICALGVQIRRGITAHGIGLNVHDHPAPPEYQHHQTATTQSVHRPPASLDHPSTTAPPGYLTWGFTRILACGLPGKSVTWLSREATSPPTRTPPSSSHNDADTNSNPSPFPPHEQTHHPCLRALPPTNTSTSTPSQTHTAARLLAEEFADALALGLNTSHPSPPTTPPTTEQELAAPTTPAPPFLKIPTPSGRTSVTHNPPPSSSIPRTRAASGSENQHPGLRVQSITLHDIAAW